MKKPMKNKNSIDPNRLPTRDPLMVALINGATKAAVHVDRKKQQRKLACRNRENRHEED